jgi:hypothetical protein
VGTRIPKALQAEVEAISTLTDAFCAEQLDPEYAELCRRLVAKLARKRPSPLARADLRFWAAAVLYTVGSLNFLFDRSQPLHLSADELTVLTGVPKSTMANKAKRIRDLLGLGPLACEFWRRDLLERSGLAWLVVVNGIAVDALASARVPGGGAPARSRPRSRAERSYCLTPPLL